MNQLLNHYIVDVEYPDVSGAELLEMLQIRDKLAQIAATLSPDEQERLMQADNQFIQQAAVFYASLLPFIDFQQRRQSQQPPSEYWWWYLDVLAQLPPINHRITLVFEPKLTQKELFDNKSKLFHESKLNQYT